jgi:hypothetical protein
MDGLPDSLNGVSCSASVRCEAVGQYYDPPEEYQTLVLVGNERALSLRSRPNPSNEDPLLGVSCASSTNRLAVGTYDGGPGTLIESNNHRN